MLRKHLRLTPGITLLVDIIVTAASFFLTFGFRDFLINLYPFGAQISYSEHILLLPPIIVLWTILLQVHNQSSHLEFTSFTKELKHILKTVIWGELILLMILYSFRVNYISRSFVFLFSITNFACLFIEKYILLICIQHLRDRGHNRKSVLIIGDGKNSKRLIDSIQTHSDWGLNIVGFLDANGFQAGDELSGAKILGRLEDLKSVLHSHFIEEVIFALPLSKLENAKDLLIQCEMEGVQTRIISDFFSDLVSRAEVDVVHGIPVITHSMTPQKNWEMYLKRFIDIFLSLVGLILLSPLFTIISIAIKLTSSGPIFYRWKVVGLNKKQFTSYKFRTMVVDADRLKEKLMEKNEMNGVVFKMKRDPRITSVGQFLRKYSLDELPQLFSVFKGEMSLVGPRPPLVTEIPRFESWQRRKLSVKPGITCLWQCNGRNHIKDFNEWVLMDLKYIDNWSLWLDFKILVKTIPAVLSGKGAY